MTAESGSTLNDDITAGGNITLEDGVTAWNDIETSGTLYVGCNVDYSETNVDADGGVVNTCNN
ncbi:hypothetical protein GCM10028857_24490 [Salinarchaeum chitinilyticum]